MEYEAKCPQDDALQSNNIRLPLFISLQKENRELSSTVASSDVMRIQAAEQTSRPGSANSPSHSPKAEMSFCLAFSCPV